MNNYTNYINNFKKQLIIKILISILFFLFMIILLFIPIFKSVSDTGIKNISQFEFFKTTIPNYLFLIDDFMNYVVESESEYSEYLVIMYQSLSSMFYFSAFILLTIYILSLPYLVYDITKSIVNIKNIDDYTLKIHDFIRHYDFSRNASAKRYVNTVTGNNNSFSLIILFVICFFFQKISNYYSCMIGPSSYLICFNLVIIIPIILFIAASVLNSINKKNFKKIKYAIRREEDKKQKTQSEVIVENLDRGNDNNQRAIETIERNNIIMGESTNQVAQKRDEHNGRGIRCPHCGGTNLQAVSDTHGKGASCLKLFFCGFLGLCGAGKTKTDHYWVCQNCGKKFKM